MHERDDAGHLLGACESLYAVGCPTECLNVQVPGGGSHADSCDLLVPHAECVAHSLLNFGIPDVGVVIGRRLLASGPWRIGDDDADRQLVLSAGAGRVVIEPGHAALACCVAEGIAEDDAAVLVVVGADATFGGCSLDLESCDVVGEQHDFVGVHFRWGAVPMFTFVVALRGRAVATSSAVLAYEVAVFDERTAV